jgi:hypothetical protein
MKNNCISCFPFKKKKMGLESEIFISTYSCHKPIKISKIDNASPKARKKWEKSERDGTTPHQCGSNSNSNSSSANSYNPNKKYHEQNRQEQEEDTSTQTVTVDNGPQLAELANQVKDLKKNVKVLISQIQMPRIEVKKTKCVDEHQSFLF